MREDTPPWHCATWGHRLPACDAGKPPGPQSSKEPRLLRAGEQPAYYYGMRFRWRGAACRNRATKPIPIPLASEFLELFFFVHGPNLSTTRLQFAIQ